MQAFYEAHFEREMGCSEREWLMWLPAALGDNPWSQQGQRVTVEIGAGRLQLSWNVAEPRRLGLASFPRLMVRFAFEDLDEARRQTFMKRFDLYMQRGGG